MIIYDLFVWYIYGYLCEYACEQTGWAADRSIIVREGCLTIIDLLKSSDLNVTQFVAFEMNRFRSRSSNTLLATDIQHFLFLPSSTSSFPPQSLRMLSITSLYTLHHLFLPSTSHSDHLPPLHTLYHLFLPSTTFSYHHILFLWSRYSLASILVIHFSSITAFRSQHNYDLKSLSSYVPLQPGYILLIEREVKTWVCRPITRTAIGSDGEFTNNLRRHTHRRIW